MGRHLSHARILMLGVLVALAAAGPAPAVRIVSCDIPGAVAADRIFRLGSGSFQEWDPHARAFGTNLCEAFACAANAERSEGAISTASLIVRIGVDHGTGQPYWRTQGASNLTQTEGACRFVPDPSIAKRP